MTSIDMTVICDPIVAILFYRIHFFAVPTAMELATRAVSATPKVVLLVETALRGKAIYFRSSARTYYGTIRINT